MSTILNRYQSELAAQHIQMDTHQEAAAREMDALITRVTKEKSLLSFLKNKQPVKGLYLYGSVGRGKTMLMDWGLQALKEKSVAVERWHFHAFMLEIHANLRDLSVHSKALDNHIRRLADQWAERLRVLCFDEFHVTDVADAMIMMPLFTRLFERGVVVITTSNWKPEDLYSGGLQRQRFLPFIDTLKKYMTVFNVDGTQDYRQIKHQNVHGWLWPMTPETFEQMDVAFRDAVGYDAIETHEIHVGGRTWIIPRASRDVAWLDMHSFLDQPLGAADFLAIAARYKLLFLDNLAPFNIDGSDKAKRFMIMIDNLYDQRVNLLVRAACPLDKLYPDDGRLRFEFGRTQSRLTEMTQAKVKTS